MSLLWSPICGIDTWDIRRLDEKDKTVALGQILDMVQVTTALSGYAFRVAGCIICILNIGSKTGVSEDFPHNIGIFLLRMCCILILKAQFHTDILTCHMQL